MSITMTAHPVITFCPGIQSVEKNSVKSPWSGTWSAYVAISRSTW